MHIGTWWNIHPLDPGWRKKKHGERAGRGGFELGGMGRLGGGYVMVMPQHNPIYLTADGAQ